MVCQVVKNLKGQRIIRETVVCRSQGKLHVKNQDGYSALRSAAGCPTLICEGYTQVS